MKKFTNIISGIKNTFIRTSSNAILLFVTGFFFTQFMLVNVLYAKHPLGGWVTGLGIFSTQSILIALLLVLSLCLFALWRSVTKSETSNELFELKTSIVKVRNSFSPIDHPKGSTKPVVSGYALG